MYFPGLFRVPYSYPMFGTDTSRSKMRCGNFFVDEGRTLERSRQLVSSLQGEGQKSSDHIRVSSSVVEEACVDLRGAGFRSVIGGATLRMAGASGVAEEEEEELSTAWYP